MTFSFSVGYVMLQRVTDDMTIAALRMHDTPPFYGRQPEKDVPVLVPDDYPTVHDAILAACAAAPPDPVAAGALLKLSYHGLHRPIATVGGVTFMLECDRNGYPRNPNELCLYRGDVYAGQIHLNPKSVSLAVRGKESKRYASKEEAIAAALEECCRPDSAHEALHFRAKRDEFVASIAAAWSGPHRAIAIGPTETTPDMLIAPNAWVQVTRVQDETILGNVRLVRRKERWCVEAEHLTRYGRPTRSGIFSRVDDAIRFVQGNPIPDHSSRSDLVVRGAEAWRRLGSYLDYVFLTPVDPDTPDNPLMARPYVLVIAKEQRPQAPGVIIRNRGSAWEVSGSASRRVGSWKTRAVAARHAARALLSALPDARTSVLALATVLEPLLPRPAGEI